MANYFTFYHLQTIESMQQEVSSDSSSEDEIDNTNADMDDIDLVDIREQAGVSGGVDAWP